MIARESFEVVSESLKPDPSNAQILLEAATGSPTLAEALEILEASGFEIARYEIIHRENCDLILIRLSMLDMRAAALRLSEAGFKKLVGMNAGDCAFHRPELLEERNDDIEDK